MGHTYMPTEVRLDLQTFLSEFHSGGGTVPLEWYTNQLDKTMPADFFHDLYNNCGPACVAAILYDVLKRKIYPDAIADTMAQLAGRGREDVEGYTYVSDLASALRHYGVPATVRTARSLAEFKSILRAQTALGRLSICLFWFDWEDNDGGHFEVNFGTDVGRGVKFLNPYGGGILDTTWEDAWNNRKGAEQNAPMSIVCADKAPAPAAPTVFVENMTAVTRTTVNMRANPTSKSADVGTIPANTRVLCTHYTDKGEAHALSVPDTRWHKVRYGGKVGWIYDGGCVQSSFRAA